MHRASSAWIFAVSTLATAGGCASARPRSDAMPKVEIRPGVPGRIALMDAYRLGDDIRKQMMARPRVWVEEVPESEAASEPEAESTESQGGSE
jgi:hypothetical protein